MHVMSIITVVRTTPPQYSFQGVIPLSVPGEACLGPRTPGIPVACGCPPQAGVQDLTPPLSLRKFRGLRVHRKLLFPRWLACHVSQIQAAWQARRFEL